VTAPAPTSDDILPLLLARVVFPSFHPLHGQHGEVLGFAVRCRSGIVLFDTGVGEGSDVVDGFYAPERRPLADALADHGVALTEVTAVVNSHLHFDHCGNNHLLPGVPIYAQTEELQAARTPRYTIPEWIDFPGAEYRSVEGEHQVARDVRIVPTPGHTGGHQSLVVHVAGVDRPIVLAGQAIASAAECELLAAGGSVGEGDPPPDPDAYLASAHRLLSLRPRRVHFSHDRAVWSAR